MLIPPRKFIAGIALLALVGVFLLLLVYNYRSAAINRAIRPLIVEYLRSNVSPDAAIGGIYVSGQNIIVDNLLLGGGVDENFQIEIKRLIFPFERELFTQNRLSRLEIFEPVVSVSLPDEETAEVKEPMKFVSPIEIASVLVNGGRFSFIGQDGQLSLTHIEGEVSIADGIIFDLSSRINDRHPVEASGGAFLNGRPLFTLKSGQWNNKVFIKEESFYELLPEGNSSSFVSLHSQLFSVKDAEELLDTLGIDSPELLAAIDAEFKELDLSFSQTPDAHSLLVQSKSGSFIYEDFALSHLSDIEIRSSNATLESISFFAQEARVGEFGVSEVHFKGAGLSYHDEMLEGDVLISAASPEVQADLRLADDRIRIRSLALNGFTYFSEDGLTAVTDGAVTIRGNLRSIFSESIEGNLILELAASELLYNTFYSDFSEQGARAELDFSFNKPERLLRIESSKISVTNLGELTVKGDILADSSSSKAKITGQLNIPAAKAAYRTYFADMFSQTLAELDQLEVSGKIGASFNLFLDDGLALETELYPEGFTLIHAPWSLELVDINGALPFSFNRQVSFSRADLPRKGSLSIKNASVGVLSLRQNSLNFESVPNGLSLTSGLEWVVADGSLHIDSIEAGFDSSFGFSTRSRIAGVNLAKLTAELGIVPMAGFISGDLGEIIYSENSIVTNGRVLIDVFGGEIVLEGIQFEDPFTPYSKLRGDVNFSGIDLYDLTHTFSFGEINGIIDGAVNRLEMLGFVPIEFDAFVRTRSRGSRNISVKALNNIGVISQGRVMSALERGIYKFIDFYRYQTMAFDCRLRNDIFYLEGRARPGSEEYLIYGGLLPPKINVVSPYRTIPFKEMVNRIRRLERAGAET